MQDKLRNTKIQTHGLVIFLGRFCMFVTNKEYIHGPACKNTFIWLVIYETLNHEHEAWWIMTWSVGESSQVAGHHCGDPFSSKVFFITFEKKWTIPDDNTKAIWWRCCGLMASAGGRAMVNTYMDQKLVNAYVACPFSTDSLQDGSCYWHHVNINIVLFFCAYNCPVLEFVSLQFCSNFRHTP
jgi:hypothetical protein